MELQAKMCDIISTALRRTNILRLDEEEAIGKFRWLIPKEDVDWDTPVFSAFPEHPRFIKGKGRQKPSSK